MTKQDYNLAYRQPFCAAINCMDGRVQIPVIRYLQERFGVLYVDAITEPGPNRILAERETPEQVASILARLAISIEQHGTQQVAIVGHHDCAGNPAPAAIQKEQIRQAAAFLRQQHPQLDVIGLWVDENWQVWPIAQRR